MEIEERITNMIIDDVFNIIDLFFKPDNKDKIAEKLTKLIDKIPYEEQHYNFKLLLSAPEALDMMLENAKAAGMNFVLHAEKEDKFQMSDVLTFKTKEEITEFIEKNPEIKGHNFKTYPIHEFITQYGYNGTRRAEVIKKMKNTLVYPVIMYQSRIRFEKKFNNTNLNAKHQEEVSKAYSLIEKEAKILRLYQLKQKAIELRLNVAKSKISAHKATSDFEKLVNEIKSINNYSASLTGSEQQQQRYFIENNKKLHQGIPENVETIKSFILQEAANRTKADDAKKEMKHKTDSQQKIS